MRFMRNRHQVGHVELVSDELMHLQRLVIRVLELQSDCPSYPEPGAQRDREKPGRIRLAIAKNRTTSDRSDLDVGNRQFFLRISVFPDDRTPQRHGPGVRTGPENPGKNRQQRDHGGHHDHQLPFAAHRLFAIRLLAVCLPDRLAGPVAAHLASHSATLTSPPPPGILRRQAPPPDF
jgi:hypothetical protein